jgi:hypothetical protein
MYLAPSLGKAMQVRELINFFMKEPSSWANRVISAFSTTTLASFQVYKLKYLEKKKKMLCLEKKKILFCFRKHQVIPFVVRIYIAGVVTHDLRIVSRTQTYDFDLQRNK